jgi:hypothetical protein
MAGQVLSRQAVPTPNSHSPSAGYSASADVKRLARSCAHIRDLRVRTNPLARADATRVVAVERDCLLEVPLSGVPCVGLMGCSRWVKHNRFNLSNLAEWIAGNLAKAITEILKIKPEPKPLTILKLDVDKRGESTPGCNLPMESSRRRVLSAREVLYSARPG